MILQAAVDPGVVLDVMSKNAGVLTGAVGHILYAWTPRKGWEPRAEDLPVFVRGAVTLLAAVALAWLALRYLSVSRDQLLRDLIIETSVFLIVFVAYLVLFLAWTRTIVAASKGKTKEVRAVVGFVLNSHTRDQLAGGATIGNILAGNRYKPEEVWAPWSVVIARVLLALLWIGYLVLGTLLLAAVVLLIFAPRVG